MAQRRQHTQTMEIFFKLEWNCACTKYELNASIDRIYTNKCIALLSLKLLRLYIVSNGISQVPVIIVHEWQLAHFLCFHRFNHLPYRVNMFYLCVLMRDKLIWARERRHNFIKYFRWSDDNKSKILQNLKNHLFTGKTWILLTHGVNR